MNRPIMLRSSTYKFQPNLCPCLAPPLVAGNPLIEIRFTLHASRNTNKICILKIRIDKKLIVFSTNQKDY